MTRHDALTLAIYLTTVLAAWAYLLLALSAGGTA